ncbi:hypothetical protein ACFXKG_39540 [Streptomyces sp. NPDC059255]|uniref:aromatic-ring hydroxylase C-terminal domain-containing protein n=1 Tax=Streptomyces sp. NPDC059255 TaxID=3346793 RepID=UPI00368C365B
MKNALIRLKSTQKSNTQNPWFLLLDLVGDGSIDAAVDGADRVRLVHRPVPDPDAAALLVRPDGYVAWAGAETTGLRDALDRWYAV